MKNTHGRIVAIVVQFGPIEELFESLEHLKNCDSLLSGIVVVDNGPGDAPRDADLVERFPGIQYHWSKRNLGFTGGCNAGIRIAEEIGYDRLLVINNDVYPNVDAIRLLDAALENDATIGISGPVTYYPKATVPLYSGARINWRRGKYKVQPSAWPHKAGPPYDVDIVSGCAMMFRRESIEKIGAFDERYFLYWEDVDMCARARESGYRTVIVPGARMDHRLSATTGSGSPLFIYYETRNRLLFFQQHATGAWSRRRLMTRLTFARAWMGLRRIVSGDRATGRAYLIGVADFLRGRFGKNSNFGS